VFVGKQGGEGVGEVESGSVIEFDRVPVVTPTGDVLLRSLSLKVEAGGNVLVTGPNGAGKSSIFRYGPPQLQPPLQLQPRLQNHPPGPMSCAEVVPLSLSVCVSIRILCGLWPVRGGRVVKPCRGQLFYIPQKPYLPLGNLRDQVRHSPGFVV
jgi:hypothetical protein